jgi:ABC-type branched-subunit amino acid transport system ATPase component
MADALLETHRLTKRFDSVSTVQDVSLAVVRGEVHAIIGLDGAGTTTFFGRSYNFVSSVHNLTDHRALEYLGV